MKMKSITVYIDNRVFEGLKAEKALIEWSNGCVPPPSNLEKRMIEILNKIEEGAPTATISIRSPETKENCGDRNSNNQEEINEEHT